MTLNDFVNAWSGNYADFDGFYGYQCWDLAAFYVRDVVGCPSLPTGPLGGAIECFTVFSEPLPTYFDKIPNDPNDPNVQPLPGDVVVWGAMPGFGPYGHIGVCLSATSTGFTSFDQNWPVNSAPHAQNHNYNYVLGWLRPKQTGGETVDERHDLTIALYTVRGNGATDGDWANWLNYKANHPEAGVYTYVQEFFLSTLYVSKDVHDKAIADLNDQIKKLTDQLSSQPTTPPSPPQGPVGQDLISVIINWIKSIKW